MEAVMEKINELSFQLLEEVKSGRPFHDIGVASLRFKRISCSFSRFRHESKLVHGKLRSRYGPGN